MTYYVRSRDFSSFYEGFCSRHYLAYAKVIFVNCPAMSQSVKSICAAFDIGTGLASLSTMSMTNG